MLYLLVNIGFHILFHSPPGVLFTFPSRYFFSIGHQVVFSLWGWSPFLPTKFLVFSSTLDPISLPQLSITGLSPSSVCLPRHVLLVSSVDYMVLNPISISKYGLGSSSFARHYLRNRFLFLFLPLLRCFSSRRSPLIHYFTHVWILDLLLSSVFPHSDIYGSRNICFSP